MNLDNRGTTRKDDRVICRLLQNEAGTIGLEIGMRETNVQLLYGNICIAFLKDNGEEKGEMTIKETCFLLSKIQITTEPSVKSSAVDRSEIQFSWTSLPIKSKN